MPTFPRASDEATQFGGAAIQRHDGGGVDRCTSAQRDGVVEDLDPADSTAPRGEEKKPADW